MIINPRNASVGHVEHFGQPNHHSVFGWLISYVLNCFVIEFCHTVARSFLNLFGVGMGAIPRASRNPFWMELGTMLVSFCSSSFHRTVHVVVQIGSKEKMRWVNTDWIVASVADVKPIRNITKMNSPRSAVGSIISFSVFRKPKLTVIGSGNFPSRPNPTISKFWFFTWDWTSFVNSFPKPSFKGFVHHKQKTPSSDESVVGTYEPQTPDDGGKSLSAYVFSGYNRAMRNLTKAFAAAT